MAQLSVEIGAALGLDTHLLGVLFKGALLHDIGKMLIPREVLFKKGALTPTERQEIQSHPSLGVQILDGVPGFEEIREIVLGHHEKIDGSGYPRGLSAPKIPILTRIVTVADVYDALRAQRPYRKGFPCPEVEKIIKEDPGLDKQVVETLYKQVLAQPAARWPAFCQYNPIKIKMPD
ncbi:MAG: HD domain-containing protein [Firmicutes bacterium]|nr:HD domain-containing protein [Bacillota bacterium]